MFFCRKFSLPFRIGAVTWVLVSPLLGEKEGLEAGHETILLQFREDICSEEVQNIGQLKEWVEKQLWGTENWFEGTRLLGKAGLIRNRLIESLVYYEALYEAAVDQGLVNWRLRALNDLGVVFQRGGSLVQAELILQEAVALALETKSWNQWAMGLNNLAYVQAGLGKLESAQELLVKVLDFHRQIPLPERIGNTYYQLGLFELEFERTQEAREYFRKSLRAYRSVGAEDQLSCPYWGMAQSFAREGLQEDGFTHANSAVEMALNFGQLEDASQFRTLLGQYRETGQGWKAADLLWEELNSLKLTPLDSASMGEFRIRADQFIRNHGLAKARNPRFSGPLSLGILLCGTAVVAFWMGRKFHQKSLTGYYQRGLLAMQGNEPTHEPAVQADSRVTAENRSWVDPEEEALPVFSGPLVIGDEKLLNRRIFGLYAEKMGMDVVEYSSAHAAVEYLKEAATVRGCLLSADGLSSEDYATLSLLHATKPEKLGFTTVLGSPDNSAIDQLKQAADCFGVVKLPLSDGEVKRILNRVLESSREPHIG